MTRKPELTPTTGRQVVVATLAGAVVGWMILSIFDLLNAFPPVAPWLPPPEEDDDEEDFAFAVRTTREVI